MWLIHENVRVDRVAIYIYSFAKHLLFKILFLDVRNEAC